MEGTNVVRNISRIIQYFDEILPTEKLSPRAEQLRQDLLRLAVDLHQVAQVSEVSRTTRSNSTRSRSSSLGQKDLQDFVAKQLQIARGELPKDAVHFNTMPSRVTKARPKLFQSWLKEDQQNEDNKGSNNIVSRRNQSSRLSRITDNEDDYQDKHPLQKNTVRIQADESQVERSMRRIMKHEVAINIDDVIHSAKFVGQVYEYQADKQENKLRWCVVTKELGLYVFDSFHEPYVQKIQLPGYRVSLSTIDANRHFLIKLTQHQNAHDSITFIIDNRMDVVKWLSILCSATCPDAEVYYGLIGDESVSNKLNKLQEENRRKQVAIRKRISKDSSQTKQCRSRSIGSASEEDISDDIFLQLKKLRLSILHSSLPIGQDIENALSEIAKQEMAKIASERKMSFQDELTSRISVADSEIRRRCKSSEDLRDPQGIDNSKSNSVEAIYEDTGSAKQYESASSISSAIYLKGDEVKASTLYEDYLYEIPDLVKQNRFLASSGPKELSQLKPKLRRPPSPPDFKIYPGLRRTSSDSLRNMTTETDRNAELYEKLAKKSLLTGYLMRCGTESGQKKRWCILTKDRLYFFSKAGDWLPLSIIKLRDCRLDESQITDKLMITLICRKSKMIRMAFSTLHEYNMWLCALKSTLEEINVVSSEFDSVHSSKDTKEKIDDSDTSDGDSEIATTSSGSKSVFVDKSLTSISTKTGIALVDSDPSSGGSVMSYNYEQSSFFRSAYQGNVERLIHVNDEFTWQSRWCEIHSNIFYSYIRDRNSIACEFNVFLTQCQAKILDLTSVNRSHTFKLLSSTNEEIAVFAADSHEALQTIVGIIKHTSEISSFLSDGDHTKETYEVKTRTGLFSSDSDNRKPKLPIALLQHRPLPLPGSPLTTRSRSSQNISIDNNTLDKPANIAQDLIMPEAIYQMPTTVTTKVNDDIYEDIDKAKKVILQMHVETGNIKDTSTKATDEDFEENFEDLYEKVDDLKERIRKKSKSEDASKESQPSPILPKPASSTSQSSSVKMSTTDSENEKKQGQSSISDSQNSYATPSKLRAIDRTSSTSSQTSREDQTFSSKSRSSFSDGEIVIKEGALNLPKQSMMSLAWKKRWCVLKATERASRLLVFRHKHDQSPTHVYVLSRMELTVDLKLPTEFKLKCISGDDAGSILHCQAFSRDEAASWAEALLKHTIVSRHSDATLVASFIAGSPPASGSTSPNFSRSKSKRLFSAFFESRTRSDSLPDVHSGSKMDKSLQKKLSKVVREEKKAAASLEHLTQQERQLQREVEETASYVKQTRLDLRTAQEAQRNAASPSAAEAAGRKCDKLFKKLQSLERSLEKSMLALNRTQTEIKQL